MAATSLRLTIGLPMRNQVELQKLLHDLYDSASPSYHHYLTSDQFTARFGPADNDYNAVIQFAASNGLKVVRIHPNRAVIEVSGAVSKVVWLRRNL